MDSRKTIKKPQNWAMNLLLPVWVVSISLCYSSCKSSYAKSINSQAKDVFIDADTANEIDDLYAIVRAVQSPKLSVVGLTAAQFHTSPYATSHTANESQMLNEKLLKLLERTDIPLAQGRNTPIQDTTHAAVNKATDLLVKTARKYSNQNKLDVVILGSCTNVATAIMKDHSIVDRIRVHYIGFWHDQEANTWNKKEFNTGNDPLATNYLLNQKTLEFHAMTATTSQHLTFSYTNATKYLNGKHKALQLLLDRWNTYERWWTKEDPEKTSWIMWDVAIIEALIEPNTATQMQFQLPEENYFNTISVYTMIDADRMRQSFWSAMINIENNL